MNKKYIITIIMLLGICTVAACGKIANPESKNKIHSTENTELLQETVDKNTEATEETKKVQEETYILPEGTTLGARIKVPETYERILAEDGTFQAFLRNYPVKEDGNPVLLYNGKEKSNRNAHVAVFELPIESEDLQQCADSVMRMYAEYFWASRQYENIVFHFTNGFPAEYIKWREGYRISVEGNQTFWVKSAEYDDSYENFVKYLRMVFAYAGTLSMESETEAILLEEIQAGDVFLMGGSPGHVVMVVDVCENPEGKKAFLLAQGYMPAQEFHVLKNPLHTENPWYYEDEIQYPLETPEYFFEEGSLRRLHYMAK